VLKRIVDLLRVERPLALRFSRARGAAVAAAAAAVAAAAERA
jgi:hypothetical protein